MSELEKEQTPRKMHYEEFFEVVLGKASGITEEINTKIEELTDWLLKELEKYAVDNSLPIPQWILDKHPSRPEKTPAAICPLRSDTTKDGKTENTIKAEPDRSIQYEQVSVKIPVAVMDLLRHSQSNTGHTLEQDIEYALVENVRSRIESGLFLPTPKALADQYSLNPVFEAILNDSIE